MKTQARDAQGLNQVGKNGNEEERGNLLEQDLPMFCLQITCIQFVSNI